ncbi:heparinase II/III domain-containing protein [Tunicatimonas pelagia]|uniref:heparinase II/III domain-containing protein n=1 Tax=Tunicatimonas pelagia TaxID=931531 RepID=UPI002666F682|nr:heparinase II/III family protein [Tunicatimonas pelagia]WKN43161.1 heparinase II/III family protein [Tunicatimonas pelagia]
MRTWKTELGKKSYSSIYSMTSPANEILFFSLRLKTGVRQKHVLPGRMRLYDLQHPPVNRWEAPEFTWLIRATMATGYITLLRLLQHCRTSPKTISLALIAWLVCWQFTLVSAQESNPTVVWDIASFQQQLSTHKEVADLWSILKKAADSDLTEPAWTPASELPGREAVHVNRRNLNDGLMRKVGRRIERAALVYRITGDERYLASAWRQITVLFNDPLWADWRDLAHQNYANSYVDIRTGDLSAALGITYGWLQEGLTEEQRAEFIEGVDRQVIQPFLKSVEQNVWWLDAGHNWTTRVVGGIGILGVALQGSHPQAGQIITIAEEAMYGYLDHLGEDGSFNESPGYVSDLTAAARYFKVRSGSQSDKAKKTINQLVKAAHWTVWTLLPGFRQMAFGDTKTKRPLRSEFAGAIAAASGDQLTQWLFLSGGNLREGIDPRRLDPEAVLAYNPSVKPLSPAELLPLAKAFYNQGGLVISRTGWDLSSESQDVVVYAKHGREQSHGHDDVGQVAMTVGTQAIIVEVGNNFTYPSDYFGTNRPEYYPASARGHNIITFGSEPDAGMNPQGRGELVFFEEEESSTHWKMDLSKAYLDQRKVTREVLHGRPSLLVVLDEVELPNEEQITLRWHSGGEPTSLIPGGYQFQAGDHTAALHITALAGKSPTYSVQNHSFAPPYDESRDGQKLPQYREPLVSITTQDKAIRWLTVVAFAQGSSTPIVQQIDQNTWQIEHGGKKVTVLLTSDGLEWKQ